MKLILRADVDALGRVGDIVTVKAGFGRNYLIPQGLAMPASNANQKQFELERKKLEANAGELRNSASDVAEKIAATPVEISVRVGEGEKLYGSVTTQMIADAMAEKGLEIDKRKIMLRDPIRSLGDYEIEIKLHAEVHGTLNLSVTRHGLPEFVEAATPETVKTVETEAQDTDGELEKEETA
ncbi:MAG: 50S ribosomal protein L9 [Proteobacteria bacterium]|nr:50S ribosomal protein L9 [Pseudomonadota bacterium]